MSYTQGNVCFIYGIMNQYWVYILASHKNGTLYVGVTSDLMGRSWQHKHGLSKFTNQYAVNKLIYFEEFGDVELAIAREKRLKKWNRKWKLRLIEKKNPNWDDLYTSLF